jgi:phosphoribosyl 1,2-cyclic phosphodiesterase
MKHFKSVPPEITEAFDGAFRIGDITVTPIPLSHDSNFCFGYTFERGAAKISIATDLGFIDDDVIAKMEHSQIVLLESNHDITQLNNNKKYSPFLKRRILGATGHLSNPQCAAAVYKLYQSGLTQVVLAHLSRENNSPNTAYTTVCEFLKRNGVTEGEDIWVDVALQDTVGRVFQTE